MATPAAAADSLLALLAEAGRLVEAVPPGELGGVLGEAERLRGLVMAQLVISAGRPPTERPDRLLGAQETASRLGMATATLYRRAPSLAFCVRQGRSVRFSETGLERYLRARQGR